MGSHKTYCNKVQSIACRDETRLWPDSLQHDSQELYKYSDCDRSKNKFPLE